MAFDNLLLERDGAVAIVTINRPNVLNALNSHTVDELRRLMLELKHDAAVGAIVLTGAGGKAFVAGADINELAVQTPTGGREHALTGQHVFDVIENLGKPVIAAINGFALGGGCELAMACTLRLAADTAKLGPGAPVAMRYIISAVNKGVEMPFAEACQYEATLFGLVASTEDMREGTAAFLEKRKPEFKGR